jgi:hypothetical protein
MTAAPASAWIRPAPSRGRWNAPTASGFALANRAYDLRLIQDYLGHRDPKHTVRYTRTAGRRFEGLWRLELQTAILHSFAVTGPGWRDQEEVCGIYAATA